MDSKEQRSALRAAVYRGDGRAVVDLLRGVGADDDSLQLAGEGLIAGVMQRVDGAAELARGLVVGLRQRGWDGDDELADQLEAQLGSRPAAMLRALPVDLEELAGILEGDPLSVGGRIDITTGEVWPEAAIDYVLETGEEDEDTADDRERWLAVHGEGSREGYRDMEMFIASVEDPGLAISAGLLWAASDTSIKALSSHLHKLGPLVLIHPLALVILLASLIGLLISARSLQLGDAVAVIALTSAAANLTTIAAGPIVFSEPLPSGGFQLTVRLLAFALVVVAAALTPPPAARLGTVHT